MIANRGGLLVAFLLAAVAFGCGTSPETQRKQAQSNSDKFFELLKAGSPERAYQETFSAQYKRQLDYANFKSFNEALWHNYGTINSFTVVHYETEKSTNYLVMTYAVQTTGLPTPAHFLLKLGEEGSDWRIMSFEPRIQKQTHAPTVPPTGSLPGQPPAKNAGP